MELIDVTHDEMVVLAALGVTLCTVLFGLWLVVRAIHEAERQAQMLVSMVLRALPPRPWGEVRPGDVVDGWTVVGVEPSAFARASTFTLVCGPERTEINAAWDSGARVHPNVGMRSDAQ